MYLRLIALLALIALSSCGHYIPPVQQSVKNQETFSMSFEEAWNKTIDWLAMNNIQIKNLDKSSQFISAEKRLDKTYIPYMDCGYDERGYPFSNYQGNFNLTIRQIEPGKTIVIMNCFFACDYTKDMDLYSIYKLTATCYSNGKLELEFFNYLRGIKTEKPVKLETPEIEEM